jgi:SAM-dependent methyltransferase
MTTDDRQKVYWESGHKFRTYDHPVVRFFAQQRIEQIGGWLDFDKIANALDVGCGEGFSTHYMRQVVPDVCGMDRAKRMLQRHPLKRAGRVMEADAGRIPFPDNTFDLVYCWELLHHVSDPRAILLEMARVSRRYVLVAEPNRNNPFQFGFALWNREHRWVLKYSLGYLKALFRSAGLEVKHGFCGGCIFPNVTPAWLFPLLQRMPYRLPGLGISNWVLGRKPATGSSAL